MDVRHHKTIVLSDIHLGSKWSKTKEVICYLKYNTCDTLFLCIIRKTKSQRWKNEKSKKITKARYIGEPFKYDLNTF